MHYDALGFFERPIAAMLIIPGVATIGLNMVRARGVAAPVAEERGTVRPGRGAPRYSPVGPGTASP